MLKQKCNKICTRSISDNLQIFDERYQGIKFKTVWSEQKNREIDQWKRIEPRNRHINIPNWSLAKEQKHNNNGAKIFFCNKWYWKNWAFTCKNTKKNTNLTPFTVIHSKWIIDLNKK